MMAKPMKTLELHYSMIQLLMTGNVQFEIIQLHKCVYLTKANKYL